MASPGPARVLARWSSETHEALLLAMIDSISMETVNLTKDEIVQSMKDRGFTYTWDAIRQHLQKLRRKEGSGPAAKSDGGEGSSTPKSAKKRPAPASGKKTASAKKAAAAKLSDPQDDSEPDMESPSKRVKTEKARKGKGVKKEESGDEQPVKKEEQDDDENVGPAV